MNQLFQDQEQNVFIKVLSNPNKASREHAGATVFSQFVDVPASFALDSRVILVNKIPGLTSDLIPNTILNAEVLDLFVRVNNQFKGPVIEEFSIEKLIEELESKFVHDQNLLELLVAIRSKLSRVKKVPVHGDLQKQNILFSSQGSIALIDFEHFCFAPSELELANSLFHDDSNCLDLEYLIPRLTEMGLISIPVLSDMLTLYALKEIPQGLSAKPALKRMKSGLKRLREISKIKSSRSLPQPLVPYIAKPVSTSCFM